MRAAARLASICAVAAVTGVSTGPVRAADPPELFSELVHSDLPLFGADWADRWPVRFSGAEGQAAITCC